MLINKRSDTLNRNGRFAEDGLSVCERTSFCSAVELTNGSATMNAVELTSDSTTNKTHDFTCSTNLRTSFFFAVISESTLQPLHHFPLELGCASRRIHSPSTIVAHYCSIPPPLLLSACRRCSFQSPSPPEPRSPASHPSFFPTSSQSPRSRSQLTATTFSSLLRSRTEQF